MQMTTVQIKKTKSDLSVWICWQPSTGKNDFYWFTKNNKCSNINWLQFISPKRADYKRLQDQTPDQTQFNWIVHFINNTERHVCARASEKGEKMRWRARPTAANHSQEWTNRFSTGMETTQRISTNQTNRAIFLWMKKTKDFIKVSRKQSYNKHLIRRLTSQYGWVFFTRRLVF